MDLAYRRAVRVRQLLSRIAAYDATASFALGPLGLILVGPLAQAWGSSQTLLAAGLLLTLCTLATVVSRSVRNLPGLPTQRPGTLQV